MSCGSVFCLDFSCSGVLPLTTIPAFRHACAEPGGGLCGPGGRLHYRGQACSRPRPVEDRPVKTYDLT